MQVACNKEYALDSMCKQKLAHKKVELLYITFSLQDRRKLKLKNNVGVHFYL